MPFAAACLVPPAPALLPELTGTDVPELEPVRGAVRDAVAGLVARCDTVVVATTTAPGSLDGFGRRVGLLREPSGTWTYDLAALLCDVAAGRRRPLHPTVLPLDVDGVHDWLVAQEAALPGGPGTAGLLVLADGSTTRGSRAPGGEDARGELVDDELAAALAAGRAPSVPADVLAATGCTGAPGVAVLATLTARAPERLAVTYAAAPLGVGYLVACWDVLAGPAPDAEARP